MSGSPVPVGVLVVSGSTQSQPSGGSGCQSYEADSKLRASGPQDMVVRVTTLKSVF